MRMRMALVAGAAMVALAGCSRRDPAMNIAGAEFNQQSGVITTKQGISFNTTFLNQGNALVNLYLDGTVQVSTGATEMGQGVNTKIAQLVADEFGIDVADVRVMVTSTEKNNNTSATAASSAADINGSAAVDACSRLRARLAHCALALKARYLELYGAEGLLTDPARGFALRQGLATITEAPGLGVTLDVSRMALVGTVTREGRG